MKKEMNFARRLPCKLCPFRKDCPPGWLGRSRVESIYDELENQDKTFPCHETTGATGKASKETSHCVGALLLLEKEQDTMNNFPLRFAAMFGLLNLDALKGQDLIFNTKQEFFEHHE